MMELKGLIPVKVFMFNFQFKTSNYSGVNRATDSGVLRTIYSDDYKPHRDKKRCQPLPAPSLFRELIGLYYPDFALS